MIMITTATPIMIRVMTMIDNDENNKLPVYRGVS